MARCEKNCNRISQRLSFFANFQVWPLVEVFSAFMKNCDQGVDENHFIILISSAYLNVYNTYTF